MYNRNNLLTVTQALNNIKKAQFNSSFIKLANPSVGGSSSSNFEKAFSDLAHAYIVEKAPKLLDFEVGFQHVKKNEDNTKAFGVMIFKVGDRWLLIPTFFINGELKGHELLYIKDTNNFVPCQEKWVNYLLGKAPYVLGSSTEKDLQRLGTGKADMRQMFQPPYKYGSARRPSISHIAEPFLQKIARFALIDPINDPKYHGMAGFADFVMNTGLETVEFLTTKIASAYPLIFSAIDKFYPGLLEAAIRSGNSLQKQAKSRTFKAKISDDNPPRSILYGSEPKNKQSSPKPVIYYRESATPLIYSSLDEKDKKELLHKGVVIIDNRSIEATPHVYLDEPLNLIQPDETGVYNILCSPVYYKKCVVIHQASSSLGKTPYSVVIDADKNNNAFDYVVADKVDIWASPENFKSEFTAWWNDLPDVDEWLDSLDADSIAEAENKSSFYEKTQSTKYTYLLVGKNGSATLPFVINSVSSVDKTSGHVTFGVTFHLGSCPPGPSLDMITSKRNLDMTTSKRLDYSIRNQLTQENMHRYPYGAEPQLKVHRCGSLFAVLPGMDAILSIVPRHSDKIVYLKSNVIRVPDSYRVVRLRRSAKSPISLGRNVDAAILLSESKMSMQRGSVRWEGEIVVINSVKQKSKEAAAAKLVENYGMHKVAAYELLDTAKNKPGVKVDFFVKSAVGEPIGELARANNISVPTPDLPAMSYDSTVSPYLANTQTSFESMLPIPGAGADPNNASFYDPRGADPATLQLAQRAAAMGQKEVFDTTMLSSMLSALRMENIVDRYMGDLMRGLDRLGRILFMFYWHRDSFEKRYGKDDTPEIEDAIRNAFEAVGDIILKLKTKNINPFPESDLPSDIGEVASN